MSRIERGIERERAPARRRSFVEPPQRDQRQRQIGERERRFANGDRLFEQADGLLVPVLLLAQGGEVMPGVEVIRGGGEDCRVQKLGPGEVAHQVLLQRAGEFVSHANSNKLLISRVSLKVIHRRPLS